MLRYFIYYFLQKIKNKTNVMIILLLIKYTEGDRNGIFVEECFLSHKRKRQVVVATKWELEVQEPSSSKSGHNSLLSAKEKEAHKWPSPRKNTI